MNNIKKCTHDNRQEPVLNPALAIGVTSLGFGTGRSSSVMFVVLFWT